MRFNGGACEVPGNLVCDRVNIAEVGRKPVGGREVQSQMLEKHSRVEEDGIGKVTDDPEKLAGPNLLVEVANQ